MTRVSVIALLAATAAGCGGGQTSTDRQRVADNKAKVADQTVALAREFRAEQGGTESLDRAAWYGEVDRVEVVVADGLAAIHTAIQTKRYYDSGATRADEMCRSALVAIAEAGLGQAGWSVEVLGSDDGQIAYCSQ